MPVGTVQTTVSKKPVPQQGTREQLISDCERLLLAQKVKASAFCPARPALGRFHVEHRGDWADMGNSEAEQRRVLHIVDRNRQLLKQIDAALARIKAGKFGICAGCDEAIDAMRLLARPECALCVDCQKAYEEAKPDEDEDDGDRRH